MQASILHDQQYKALEKRRNLRSMKDLEVKERYGKNLIEEEIKNMNELAEVNKLEEIERGMLEKLK